MYNLAPCSQAIFPGLLGEIENDLLLSGIDPAIVRGELIGFTSLLTQGTADIVWPNGQSLRIGSSSLVIGPSGYGKSIVFHELMRAIEEGLREHADAPNFASGFLQDDPSSEALTERMQSCPVSGLICEEGGQVTDLIRKSATLVKLLDGSTLRSARISRGRIEVKNPRLTMLLLLQPQVAAEQLSLLKASQNSVGLPNRAFISCGQRPPSNGPMAKMGLSNHVRHRYRELVEDLLEKTRMYLMGHQVRPRIGLSAEAKEYLQHLKEEVRALQHPNSPFVSISQYVQRHPERVLTLAGSIHAFVYQPEGEVNLSTLQIADQLGRDSVDTFRLLTYQQPKVSRAEQDAQCIAKMIVYNRAFLPSQKISSKLLRVWMKNAGLTPARFGTALPLLAARGLVQIGLEAGAETVDAKNLLNCPYVI